MRDKSLLNRREVLQQISVVGIGAVISACSSNGGGSAAATPSPTRILVPTGGPTSVPSTATPVVTSTQGSAATSTATGVPSSTPTQPAAVTASPSPTFTVTPGDIACILTPEETIGPYFIDVGLARGDVREDRTGTRLRLVLQLVDTDGCTPIRDAVVNIWHADASGIYSGFANQPGGVDTTGETFLRGFQVTDANGRVELITVYPGWYSGRTPHIHARIHLDSTTVLITQLYFSETVTDTVYAQAPYSSRPHRDTTNTTDSIASNDLDELLLDVVAEDGGYAGSIVFGVNL